MNLPMATLDLLRWLGALTRRLARIDASAVIGAVGASIVSHVLHVLAFMLPLKVVLLVGSEGVPRYFRFFVSEETRDQWIAILAVLTLVFYVTSLALDRYTQRATLTGSRALRTAAGTVPLAADEDAWANDHYETLVETVAKLMFAVLLLLVGLVIFPDLYAFLLVAVAAAFIVSWLALRRAEERAGRLGRALRERPKDVLARMQGLVFLLGFLFIVATFTVGDGVNLLIAIVSIIMTRQLLTALVQFSRNGMELLGDRAEIDALVYADQPLHQRDEGSATLRRLFNAQARGERLERLAQQHPETELPRITLSLWRDTGRSRPLMFKLYRDGDALAWPPLREIVYPPKQARELVYEGYLIRHLGADALRLLPRVAEYEEEGFQGRIVRWAGARSCEGRTLHRARRELLSHLWGLPLPADLTASYRRARPLLHERLDEDGLALLEAAADEPWADRVAHRLRVELPDLRARVAALPLALHHDRLNATTVVLDPQDAARLIDWRSWSLQPVGAGFILERDGLPWLADQLSTIRDERGSTAEPTLRDLLAASTLHRCVALINQAKPKTALQLLAEAFELLDLDDDELWLRAAVPDATTQPAPALQEVAEVEADEEADDEQDPVDAAADGVETRWIVRDGRPVAETVQDRARAGGGGPEPASSGQRG